MIDEYNNSVIFEENPYGGLQPVEDERQPLMVFIHGYPEFWFSWRFQLEYFSKDYW